MVRSSFLICAASALLLLLSRAYAATPMPPAQPTPVILASNAPTIAAFLSACGADQAGCADEVGTALLDEMKYDGTSTLCLPSPDYAQPAISWLNAHPEDRGMATEDGIFLALKTLYACH
jgi:hypothetical protein